MWLDLTIIICNYKCVLLKSELNPFQDSFLHLNSPILKKGKDAQKKHTNEHTILDGRL